MSKKVFTIVLIVFVVASAAHFIYHNILKSETTVTAAEQPADAFAGVTVYYFHNTKRCPTCTKIEENSYKTIHDNFAAQLESGEMKWESLNMEEPAYAHFADDYGLIVQSLVLVDNREGREGQWKNLDQIWDLVWEEEDFSNYIKKETLAFLEQK